jgi:hypothetical protein
MKNIAAGLATSAILFSSTAAWACPQCRPAVESGVYNQDFAANLFVLLLPLAVLCAIGVGLYFSDAIMAKLRHIKGAKQWQTTSNAGR